MRSLSEKQEKMFAYIKDCIEEGFPPSVREIGKAVGLRSTASVHANLRILEEAGYITRGSGLNRSIHINSEKVIRVPIVGDVTAGLPILATQQYDLGSVPYYGEGSWQDLFALQIVGDSMIDAGILDGDVVIVEKTSACRNGDIVVALIEDEATVKRFYKEDGHFRLQPENDAYAPIIVPELAILGKVVSLVRHHVV